MISSLKSIARRWLVRRLDAPDMTTALERLRELGVSPSMVFDVGAFRGDFALMSLAIWPGTRVACFEPLSKGVTQIEQLRQSHPSIDLYRTLLGADEKPDVALRAGQTETSLLSTLDSHKLPIEHVPQTMLDLVVQRHYAGRAPDFLKLDVQGYELEVLKGAEEALRPGGIRVILAEVNLLEIYQDVPLMDTLLGWLSQRGFVAYDICSLIRRPLDKALWQADMVFVRRDDPLRQDRGYFRT